MEPSPSTRDAALRGCLHDLRNHIMPMQLRLDVARRMLSASEGGVPDLERVLATMSGSMLEVRSVMARMEELLGGLAPAGTVPATGQAVARKDLRLLIVDDNRALAEALTELMEADGRFTVVHQIASMAEALSRVQGEGYDLTLVDVHLNDGDGLDLCEQLVDRHAQRVVLMSGRTDAELADEAYARGALGWIAKGADLHDLPNRLFALATNPASPPQARHR